MTDDADSIRNVADYVKLPLLYNHWYVAGLGSEFDRDPKARTLLERSIVFYRTTDGQLVAAQNRCLHRSFPLSESYLEGDELVCGYHGIRYNPEGTIVRIPSQKKCPDRKLRTYPVVEQGPLVFIWMGDEDAPEMEKRFPDFPFLANPEMLTLHGQHHLEGSYLLVQENLNDLTHFSYLHKNSAGFDDSFLDLPTVTEETEEGISCYRVERDPQKAGKFLPPDVQAHIGDRPVEQWDGGVAISPGVFKGDAPIKVGDPESDDVEIFNRYIMHYLTPETSTTHHYWWSVTDDYSPNIPEVNEMMTAAFDTVFNEDAWAVAHMQTLLDDDKTDYQAGLLFRRRVLGWVQDEYSDATATSENEQGEGQR